MKKLDTYEMWKERGELDDVIKFVKESIKHDFGFDIEMLMEAFIYSVGEEVFKNGN